MANEVKKEFNLLIEPWIAVRTQEGTREEVSILDVFKFASQYQSLAGELPAQDTAVLRLLLGVLHAAFGGKDIGGRPLSNDPDERHEDLLALWKQIWHSGAFPYAQIENYLIEFEDRFYLFHENHPFFQIPGLDKRDDVFGPFSVAKINGELAESKNKARLFPQRAGEEKNSLSYAEAARSLLYFNGFAETFGKLDTKGKTSKSDLSLGVGWLGKLGLISAVGASLFQTLMLNFVLLDINEVPWDIGQPVWEKPVNYTERNIIPMPRSQAELLTLQSRRVQLERANGRVVSVRFISGDVFPQEDALAETMTTWRYGKQQGDRTEHYRPKPFHPSVQLWRDFASLVSQGEDGRQLKPGVVRWTQYLVNQEMLPPDTHFRFQTSGISYDKMKSSISDVFSDSIAFHASLLSALHQGWITRIITGLEQTEKLVWEVGALAQNIVKAAGLRDGTKGRDHGAFARDEARSTAYYWLDPQFRLWLESIDPDKDNMDDMFDEWWETSQSTIRALGKELMHQCPPRALIGRSEQSAADAYNWFRYYTHNRETLNRRGVKKRGKSSKSDS